MSQFDVKMTELADAIKGKNTNVSGKLSVQGMIDAVDDIELAGGGVDVSSVTAKPSDVLNTAKFVDNSGVLQSGTISAVTPIVTENVFTVQKGYIKEDTELEIPEMTISNDGEKIIVPVGYNKIEQEFNLVASSGDFGVTFGVVDDGGNFEPLDITVTPPEKLADANAMPEIVIYQTNRAEPSIDGDSGEKFYFCATTLSYKYEDFVFDRYYFSTAFGIRTDEVGGDRLDRTWQGGRSDAYPYYVACQYAEDQKIWYIGSLNNRVYGDTNYIKRWYPSKAFAMAFAEADQSKSIFEQNWKRHTTRLGNIEPVDGYNLKFSYWGNSGTLASYINFEQNTVRGYGHFVGYVASDYATNEGQGSDEYTIEPRQNGEAYYWVMYLSGVVSSNGEYTATSGESRETLYVSEIFSLAEWKHFVDVKWQKCKVDPAGNSSEWFDLDMETTALETPLEDRTYTKTFWAGFPMIRKGKSWRHDGYSNVDPDLVDLTGAEMFPVDSDGLIPSPGEIYNEDCTMKIGEYIPYQPMGNEPEEAGE